MGLHVEEEEEDDSPPASPPSFSLPTQPIPQPILQAEMTTGQSPAPPVSPPASAATASTKLFSFGVDFLLNKGDGIKTEYNT